MVPPTSRDAALTYAALGWPSLPTDRADKRPLTAHGVRDATTDPGQLAAWFARWPDANVAIACGAPGPLVLDIDRPDLAPAAALELRARTEVRTGRPTGDGRHLYFAGEARRGQTWPWGELRAMGQYVVAPPSVHESGRLYEWVREPNGLLEPLPATVLALARDVERQPWAPRTGVPKGERHTYLMGYTEHLITAQGMRDEAEIAVALREEFVRACVPEPAPRADEFANLARWAVGSELMAKRVAVEAATAHLTTVFERQRAARGDLPSRAELEATVAQFGGWGDELELAEVIRHGSRQQDPLEIRFTNGGVAYFDKQEMVTVPRHWGRIILGATAGLARPSTKQGYADLLELYRALCLLAGEPLSRRTEADELRDAFGGLLAKCEPVAGSLESPTSRYELITELRARPLWDPGQSMQLARPALILADGDRYLRAGELRDWYRFQGFQIATNAFAGRMSMIGLEHVVVNGRAPRSASGERRATPSAVFYRLPGDDDVV